MSEWVRRVWDGLPDGLRAAVRDRIPVDVRRRLRAPKLTPQCRKRVVGPPGAAIGPASDPIAAILASGEYAATVELFAASDAPSLLSAQARALLYQVVRWMRPAEVVEIGALHGGTTEALARALAADGAGTVHAVEPYCAAELQRRLQRWPEPLRDYVSVHREGSMAFFMRQRHLRAGIFLVDGNHDYEYAAFDIAMAARHLAPEGFIFVDNVSQYGPFAAASDFLRIHPDFQECGGTTQAQPGRPFDSHRTRIANTDFMVLRAGPLALVGERPRSFGARLHPGHAISAIALDIAECPGGTLHAQAVLRGFGPRQTELMTQTSLPMSPCAGPLEVAVPPLRLAEDHTSVTVELWLVFEGAAPLKLARDPVPR